MMRPAGVDAEAQGQVLELRAVARERAHEWQGVVEHEAVRAVPSGREPAQHGNVEMLAVVRDEDVVADEGSKSQADFGKGGGIPDVAIRVAVDLARPRRDRPGRLGPWVKTAHARAPHHT